MVISLYAIAQSLDESRFRELRLENIAIYSTGIGQIITQSAELSIPILNTWSTKDIYDQVEGNTMFKKPHLFQAVSYLTRAIFRTTQPPHGAK